MRLALPVQCAKMLCQQVCQALCQHWRCTVSALCLYCACTVPALYQELCQKRCTVPRTVSRNVSILWQQLCQQLLCQLCQEVCQDVSTVPKKGACLTTFQGRNAKKTNILGFFSYGPGLVKNSYNFAPSGLWSGCAQFVCTMHPG